MSDSSQALLWIQQLRICFQDKKLQRMLLINDLNLQANKGTDRSLFGHQHYSSASNVARLLFLFYCVENMEPLSTFLSCFLAVCSLGQHGGAGE